MAYRAAIYLINCYGKKFGPFLTSLKTPLSGSIVQANELAGCELFSRDGEPLDNFNPYEWSGVELKDYLDRHDLRLFLQLVAKRQEKFLANLLQFVGKNYPSDLDAREELARVHLKVASESP